MGFWHTGYMEFHESASEWSGEYTPPPPPEFPCAECGRVFESSDDLAVHLFDGHVTTRPLLLLRGRECGRSRLAVIMKTQPQDWEFVHTTRVVINDRTYDPPLAKAVLAEANRGVLEVRLEGERIDQVFEFAFSVADNDDLDRVDAQLGAFVRQRALSIASIERFLEDTAVWSGADQYRFGLANYFYGVLARERSPESGLINGHLAERSYVSRFQEAAQSLSQFEQAGAEAVCGLIAFHFNQFNIAMRKTKSARLARIARRMQSIVDGKLHDSDHGAITGATGLDYALSDMETERMLCWCAVPLDGSGGERVADAEAALPYLEPGDQVKVHLIAAEHHLASGSPKTGLAHAAVLSHNRLTEAWYERYQQRASEVMR